MKKIILAALSALVFTVNAFCFTKIDFENGTSILFEPCKDGSVRFEATGQNPKAPGKDFELKRTKADSEFTLQDGNIYVWQNYVLIPLEDGYTLKADGRELYTARLSDDGKLLREKRTWKTAERFYGFGQASRKANLANQSFTIYNESKYGFLYAGFLAYKVFNPVKFCPVKFRIITVLKIDLVFSCCIVKNSSAFVSDIERNEDISVITVF